MDADIALHIVARFLHIGSAIVWLGGVAAARWFANSALPEFQRKFRNVLQVTLALSVIAGLYNYFTYGGPKHSSAYQIWFGIKFLLVLHVLATGVLWATTPVTDGPAIAKSNRRLASLAVSGFVIVLISAYLRSLSQRGL